MPDEETMMAPEEEMMMVPEEEMMMPEEEMMVMMVAIAAVDLRICRDRQAEDGCGGQNDGNFFQHGSLLFSALCLSPFPLQVQPATQDVVS